MPAPTLTDYYDLYKDDHTDVDGVETVTVTGGKLTNTVNLTEVEAKRIDMDLESLGTFASNISLEETDRFFVVWDVTLEGTELRNGYVIVLSDSSEYVIVFAERQNFETQWRCFCRKQS
jgi:hypothetical protein